MASRVQIANKYRKEISAVLEGYNILSMGQRSAVLATVDKLVMLLEVTIQESGDLQDDKDDVARLSLKLDAIAGLHVVAATPVSRQRISKKKAVGQPFVVQPARTASMFQLDVPLSLSVRNVGDGSWLKAKKRGEEAWSARSRVDNRGSAGAVGDLLSAKRKKHMHLFNLHPETDVFAVSSYVKKRIPDCVPSVERIVSRGDYASFKISVAEVHFEAIMKSDFWPCGVEFNRWKFRQNVPSVSQGT